MARGKKSYSLEEKLQKITEDIANKESALKDLKEQKKQLETEIKNQKVNELYTLIEESGKSLDEVKEFLNQ